MGDLNIGESTFPGGPVTSEQLSEDHVQKGAFGNGSMLKRQIPQIPSPFDGREAAFDAPVLD